MCVLFTGLLFSLRAYMFAVCCCDLSSASVACFCHVYNVDMYLFGYNVT